MSPALTDHLRDFALGCAFGACMAFLVGVIRAALRERKEPWS